MKFIENILIDIASITTEELQEATESMSNEESDGDSIGVLSEELQKLYIVVISNVGEEMELNEEIEVMKRKSLQLLKEDSVISKKTNPRPEDTAKILEAMDDVDKLFLKRKKQSDRTKALKAFLLCAIKEEFDLFGEDNILICAGWNVIVPKNENAVGLPDMGLAN